MKRAASLAESILHDYDEQLAGGIHLVPSSGGVFEVTLNGQTLFSKKKLGRFPNQNEVEGKLETALA